MKTVRLSGSLLDDIRDNIKSAFDRVHPEREYPVDEGHDVLARHGIMEKIQKTNCEPQSTIINKTLPV